MPEGADHAPIFTLDPAPEPDLASWLVERAGRGARHAALHRPRRGASGPGDDGGAGVGGRVEVLVPPWDVLPYDRAMPSAGVGGRRVETLAAHARPAERPRLVLTGAEAALRRLHPPRTWRGAELVSTRGRRAARTVPEASRVSS